VWVVDANRKVYVYNTSGGLLGSWTAGSLASNATVEGIATNGTDVWIVDARSDKVFKYAGAASRLSGSQNAASSFNLNSGNRDPKDIVTDGASLWVVNDTFFTDKVFKYNLAGTLVGSWTITTSGATSPTGITLDPANPSDLWIVDNGTDRVYQYMAAVSKTSGSQSAATSFALAAGNANPQGIADPPVDVAPDLATAAKLADLPTVSDSLPSRNYTPSRRSLHSAASQTETFNNLNLLQRAESGVSPPALRSWSRQEIGSVDGTILAEAFATLDDDRWSPLAADMLTISSM
jgi:hypothetical protein